MASKSRSISSKTCGGAIVVVAKCPIPGKSKTRLTKLLGAEGSALLAKSMLLDVLQQVSACPQFDSVAKILLYAPGTSDGKKHMSSLVTSLGLGIIDNLVENDGDRSNDNLLNNNLKKTWILLPMVASTSAKDLVSSDLGDKLTNALLRVRSLLSSPSFNHESSTSTQTSNLDQSGSIVFLGMDSPLIPLSELIYPLSSSMPSSFDESKHNLSCHAHICPAHDGGYGMISIPHGAPSDLVFQGVRWSTSLCCISQIKALTDCGVSVSIGLLMHDIDEPGDVFDLAELLIGRKNKAINICTVEESRAGNGDHHFCHEEHKKDMKYDALIRPSSAAQSLKNEIESGEERSFGIEPCPRTWSSLLSLGVIVEEILSKPNNPRSTSNLVYVSKKMKEYEANS